MTKKEEGEWYYEQTELGFNYRMTDIQAALGISQINRLDHFVNLRNNLSMIYDRKLLSFPILLPKTSDVISSYHLYIIKLISKSPLQRRVIFDFMRSNGIGVHVHYIPIHLQPYYRNLGFRLGGSNAESYYNSTMVYLCIPICLKLH